LADAAYPRIACSNLLCVVRRTIVYHDDLEVWVALGEYALYGLAKEASLVVAGNHHRDQRRSGTIIPSPPTTAHANYTKVDPAPILKDGPHYQLELAHPRHAHGGPEAAILSSRDFGEGSSHVWATDIDGNTLDHGVFVHHLCRDHRRATTQNPTFDIEPVAARRLPGQRRIYVEPPKLWGIHFG
jgi:hypothetical protein